MAIDTSMYRNPSSFVKAFQGGMDIADSAIEGNKKREAEQKQQKMSDLLKQHSTVGEDGRVSVNKSAYISDLMKLDPQEAMRQQDGFAQKDAETQSLAIKKQIEQMDMMGRLAGSAKDQASYEMALGQAQKFGLDTSRMPRQYDPNLVRSMQAMTLSAKEQLASQLDQQKFGLEERKFAADKSFKQKELDLKGKEKPVEMGKLASELRKERSGLPVTRATQEVSAAYNKIQSAAKNPSAAGDLSLIFNYMKMLDPGSTVREGEFANAQNAAGVQDRIINLYNRARDGRRLGDDQRTDFVNQAGGLYKSQLDLQSQVDSQFKTMAERGGIDPNDVILNFQANDPNPQQKIPESIQSMINQNPDAAKNAALAEIARRRATKTAGK